MPASADPAATRAARLTLAASRQTHATIQCLVDRDRAADAFRAYAYCRWMDDRLDRDMASRSERLAFVARQTTLLERCCAADWPDQVGLEEGWLVDLLRRNPTDNVGLRAYLWNMLAVMAFDAQRRGRLITQAELAEYTRSLATAVTEALHFFIGHNGRAPQTEIRYRAAAAAHITHMLRDTYEDVAAGYFNIPCEYLQGHALSPHDVEREPYRAWVASRVQLARADFQAGLAYLAQVESWRCRLAGYAYFARFEGVLTAIERDGYRLRPAYAEARSVSAGLRTLGTALALAAVSRRSPVTSGALPAR